MTSESDRELVEEIDNVCAALEAIREVVENPDVGDTLQTAISHTWQASILQHIDENTDVRMISSSGSSGVSLHGPNPGTFNRRTTIPKDLAEFFDMNWDTTLE